jgi:tetratricopeptide (TPR) repeat protein
LEAVAKQLDHRCYHADQRGLARQVPQPTDGRLRAKRAGDNEAELAESIKGSKLNSSYAFYHNIIGAALTLLGRPDEAIPNIKKAIALSPNHPRLNLMLTCK